MTENDKQNIDEVLKFWFEETTADQRFAKDSDFDELITAKFKDVYTNIIEGKTEAWRETPEGRLAEIIVLDQFSRNMFRDDAKSFEADVLALKLAMEAVKVGADKYMSEEHRSFIYMPYMHSESKEVHEEALSIFTKHGVENTLEFEIKHKAIIDKFGRYPYRNKLLGRESTEEELTWLEENGSF